MYVSIRSIATLASILSALGLVILGLCVGKFDDIEVEESPKFGFHPQVEPD